MLSIFIPQSAEIEKMENLNLMKNMISWNIIAQDIYKLFLKVRLVGIEVLLLVIGLTITLSILLPVSIAKCAILASIFISINLSKGG
ncbi:MAG: hypothetical protein [Microviridae sp.]|nr:MAG: hypothetical protein [Microviridae sp.]AXQ66201.1 MAG: hypothetical protein [Microviridae sp.]